LVPSGTFHYVNNLQYWNASHLIFFKVKGSSTIDNESQQEKASAPTTSTFQGMVMLLIFLHP
jgi:hypothetical protein